VQVLAAFTEGARRGRAVVLLPSAEVVAVLEDPAGLTASGQQRGVQLRMPSDRAPVVAAAIATARIFVVKAPGLGADTTATPTPPSGVQEPETGAGPGEGPDDGVPPATGPVDTGPEGTSTYGTGSPDPGSPDASSPRMSTAASSPASDLISGAMRR
jgi:hypothetical protein